jgi:hypothetical protein
MRPREICQDPPTICAKSEISSAAIKAKITVREAEKSAQEAERLEKVYETSLAATKEAAKTTIKIADI